MKRSVRNKYGFVFIGLLLTACSGTRLLPEGEKLYTGAEIKLEAAHKPRQPFIKTTAEEALRPEPNRSYLGMRPRVWMYQVAGDSPKSKFMKWLKRTGEAPVLMSSVNPGATAAIIDARLFNIGIFGSHTEFKTSEQKRTARLTYISRIHEPYTVKDLSYGITDEQVSRLIGGSSEKSLVKPGREYNLDVLKAERIRIDALLKDNGYFYFNPDYLLFRADTSEANHSVGLKLALKDSVPDEALTVYRIRKVLIDEDYSLTGEASEVPADTVRFQNTEFLVNDSVMKIRPKELLRSVFLRKNDVFSRRNHNITLNRLMSLDNFKFVRIKFSDSDTTANGYLDVTIFLTPMPKRTFKAEMDLVSKSNSYTGPRMNLSMQNKNTFRGAELLKLNMAGSFESQLNGPEKNQYSYSFNPQLELTFPRFVAPFPITKTSSIYVPKTRLSLSYNFLKRVNYFDMRTFQLVYGYQWKEDIRKEHEFNPINVSYSSIGNKSAAFNELLDSIPYLKKSYEEQFLAGGSYSFTFNEQVLPGKKIQFYFHGTTELAGNLFSLAKTISGQKIASGNPATIAGSVYSQFARLSIDSRAYYNFRNNDKLAMRLFAGVGKPYGNSSVLPYAKQFFSGGPNSLRAFQINAVGPGTYFQGDNKGFFQLGGDVKLEWNAEYRFGISRYFKGALFVDAGNVWLLKSNPTDLGSAFSFSGFANELAVGTGFGLRVDLSFFVLRFDLAMPLRKIPKSGDNFRWVTNQIDFGSSAWRSENLILNVAIGYPF